WTLTVGEQDDDVVLAFLCKQHPTADLFQPKTYLPWRPETNTPRLLARPAFATHSSPCPPPRAFRPGRDRDAGNGGPHGPDYHRRHSTTADARGCARSSAHTVARYRHAAEHATARTKAHARPGQSGLQLHGGLLRQRIQFDPGRICTFYNPVQTRTHRQTPGHGVETCQSLLK